MSRVLQHLAARGVQYGSGAYVAFSVQDSLTAHAGGGQGSATALPAQINRITTVATAGDSVILPAQGSFPTSGGEGPQTPGGLEVVVINAGANALAVFPGSGETINGGSANASVNVAAGGIATFYCPTPGAWQTGAGAASILGTLTLTGLFYESSSDNITAFAGGGQASATAMTTEVNRVTTVATAGDSVKLPASSPGLTILVINHGANAMQVFGAGTDQIDDVASATGVSQMANSMVLYTCTTAGKWYTEGLATGYVNGLQTLSFSAALTAHAGGGQASATALPSLINRVATVATQGDSVALPSAQPGLAIMVINKGANPMQVFGAGTDTINGIATATGISQGINTNATYVCNVAGNWEVPLTSLQSTTPQAVAASGALPPHVGHTYVVTKAGVAALTLAAPTAGTDDGIEITITSNTANAHTLTATGLLQTGSASVNVATFAANAGAGLTLMAYQGKWNVMSSVGITFS
jgi:hypothetical protein